MTSLREFKGVLNNVKDNLEGWRSTTTRWCARTLAITLMLGASSVAHAETECIDAEGYTPPTYTALELLGILQEVPAVAAQAEADLLSGQVPQDLFTGPYTDWYTETTERGLTELAVLRGILDAANLQHMYLLTGYTGNINAAIAQGMCGPETMNARTADGRCNKLSDPLAGAAGTRFGRNVISLFQFDPVTRQPILDGNGLPIPLVNSETTTLMSPNPREVSQKLLKRDGPTKTIPFLNMWANAWTQFMIHDWFDHGPSDSSRPIAIPLPADDPLRDEGQTVMVVGSTPADQSRIPQEYFLPASFNNVNTHWWDGSQLYGSDQATADRLRSFQGGKLKLTEDGRLPLNGQGFGDAGFNRNWWLGLEMLHTLFVKEHNAIADMLAENYPNMGDQELYDKARLINAALMAKIHTVEWTPAILPNPKLDIAMNANWYGLERFVPDPIEKQILAGGVQQVIQAGILPAETINPIIYGIMGNITDDKGVSFSMTSEFAAIYRMHQLLPEKVLLRGRFGFPRKVLTAEETTDAQAREIFESQSQASLALSFGLQKPGQLVLQNYPTFMTDLEVPFVGKIDLAAIDILRDRERGLPRYNNYRRLTNLPPLPSIEALTDDPEMQALLHEVYPGGIEQVDLFVGTLAETNRPDCYGFGETLFQTFILMASRRLQADRFYTEDYRPEVYTQEGLDWVSDNSFKSVITRHYPGLKFRMRNVENAFKPWDQTPPTKIGKKIRDLFGNN